MQRYTNCSLMRFVASDIYLQIASKPASGQKTLRQYCVGSTGIALAINHMHGRFALKNGVWHCRRTSPTGKIQE